MIKKYLLIILLLCLITVTPGCWDQTEIEFLALVRVIAIDYLPGRRAPYLVTVAIAQPIDAGGGESGGGQPQTLLFSGVGATLDLAFDRLSYNLSRRLFLSHAETVIIGKDLAEYGLHHTLDFIIRHNQIRLNSFLLQATGMAHEVLTVPERLSSGIADEILGLIEEAEEKTETVTQAAYKFLQQLVTPGQDPYTAIVMVGPPLEMTIPELQDKEGAEESGEGGSSDAGGGGSEASGSAGTRREEEVLTLAGLGAFRSSKLAGKLDHTETRGLLWFLGKADRAIVTVPDPYNPGESVNFLTDRVDTSIIPVVSNGEVSFRVEVKEEGDIRSFTGTLDLSPPETIKKLNSAKAAVIKEEMEKSLRKMQEMQTDLVGFGAILYRKHPKTFEQLQDRWREVFSNLKVEITVKSTIRRTGHQRRPFHPAR